MRVKEAIPVPTRYLPAQQYSVFPSLLSLAASGPLGFQDRLQGAELPVGEGVVEAEVGEVVLPWGEVVVEGLHLCSLRSLQKKENQNMFHLTRQFIIVCIEPFMYL